MEADLEEQNCASEGVWVAEVTIKEEKPDLWAFKDVIVGEV